MKRLWSRLPVLALVVVTGCSSPADNNGERNNDPNATANNGTNASTNNGTVPPFVVPCGPNRFVSEGRCEACPPGSLNEEGDDPTGPDTSCDPVLCEANELVEDNQCRRCPIYTFNEPGDDSSGPNTTCEDECLSGVGVPCDDLLDRVNFVSPGVQGALGASVALDGSRLVIGLTTEDGCSTGVNGDESDTGCTSAGAVYVYESTSAPDGTLNWERTAYIKAHNTEAHDNFGSRVALVGDLLAVAASGEASCATAIDGDATNNDCRVAGAVYVFRNGPNGWEQEGYLKSPTSAELQRFGSNFALGPDVLAVAASNESSCATGIDGDWNDTSARCEDTGAVFVFRRETAADDTVTWVRESYLKGATNGTGAANLSFGLGLSLQGDVLAVGSPDERDCEAGSCGSVFMFRRPADPSVEPWTLDVEIAREFSYFGRKIALEGDVLAVSIDDHSCASGVLAEPMEPAPIGPDSCPNSDGAFVFRNTNGTWTEEVYLRHEYVAEQDSFGADLGWDDGRLWVAATAEGSCGQFIPHDPQNKTCESSSIFVFGSSGGSWQQLHQFKGGDNGFSISDGFVAFGVTGGALVMPTDLLD